MYGERSKKSLKAYSHTVVAKGVKSLRVALEDKASCMNFTVSCSEWIYKVCVGLWIMCQKDVGVD